MKSFSLGIYNIFTENDKAELIQNKIDVILATAGLLGLVIYKGLAEFGINEESFLYLTVDLNEDKDRLFVLSFFNKQYSNSLDYVKISYKNINGDYRSYTSNERSLKYVLNKAEHLIRSKG